VSGLEQRQDERGEGNQQRVHERDVDHEAGLVQGQDAPEQRDRLAQVEVLSPRQRNQLEQRQC